MKCLDCGHDSPTSQKFCGECGRAFELAAIAALPAAHGYTPAHLAEKILRSRSALEGERKPVTVLFCDIADSTRMAERTGAERMHTVLSAFFEAALAEVHRYEGTVNQFLGDGFMALFGAPLAHEDHARRAVLAALAIRRRIDAGAMPDGEAPLRLRIGLNSGMVVVGKIGDNLRMDYTAIGDTTNVAARLQHEAEPGTILVSDSVFRAVDAFVECVSMGTRTLKGKSEPLAIHALVRARSAHDAHEAQHRPTPTGVIAMVGRSAEIAATHQCIERVESGVGGLLGLVGEAGLGKSRLLDEARLYARGRRLQWAEGQCVSFGRTLSYWPFREMLRSCFDIDDAHDEAAAFGKLQAGIERLFGAAAEELLPYIGALLALTLPAHLAARVRALDGFAMGHQISRATLRLFERLAAQGPLVVALEDWHWADASSAELLNHLLPLADRVAILFVVACRPESQGAAQALRRAIAAPEPACVHSQEIVLMALPQHESGQLMDSLLGGGNPPSQVRDMLLSRSGGNPFYLGELIRALIGMRGIERNLLTDDWEITERYDAVPLPDTIEGVILARIDRLEDEVKHILKAAAVVGRTFFYRILKAVTETQDALDADLAKLCRAELIGEKQRAPELEYVFKHPLIQQATYDSMVEDRRRALHRQVGQSIEHLFAERLEAFHSMLAYHFAKAQEWAKAQHYLLLAAEHADRLAADEEALELYNAVIETADRHSVAGLDALQRAQLDGKIGDAQFRAGRHELALRQFALALRRLGQRVPRSRLQLGVAVGFGLLRHMTGRFVHRSTAASTLPMPAADALCCEMWESSALIHFFTDPTHSVYDGLQIATLSRRHPESPAHVFSLSFIGMTFTALGFYRSADWCVSRAGRLARLHCETWMQGMVDHFRALHSYHVGHWKVAVSLADSAADQCWQSGNIRLWSAVVGNAVMYRFALGDPRWLDEVDRFWSVVSETTDRQSQGWALTGIALAQEHRGEHTQALAMIDKAADIYASVPDPRLLAHAWGVRCTNLLKLGRVAEAITCSEQAMVLIKRHHLSGSWTTRPLLASAEARLARFEAAPAEQRAPSRRLATVAVQVALRQGRKVRDEGAVESQRIAGTFAWLKGDRRRADAHWQHGLADAHLLGARHAQARLYFERGRRIGNRDDLERAEGLFAQCRAAGEQRELQAFLDAGDLGAATMGA